MHRSPFILLFNLSLTLLFAVPLHAQTRKPAEFSMQVQDVPVTGVFHHWVSDWVHFQIPAGVENFQIVVSGSPDQVLQVTDLIAPDGRAYISSDANPTKLTKYSQPLLRNVVSANRSEGVVPGVGSVFVPNNPALPKPMAGTWKMRSLSHKEPARKFVSFFLQLTSDMAPRKTKIPLRVWVAKESQWSLLETKKLVAEAARVFEGVGLTVDLKGIEILPLPATAPMVLPRQMADIAIQQNDPDSINAYMMSAMQYQNKPVNGLACLAGPVGLPLAHGCFVSMYADARINEIRFEQQAKILVHEIAHYMGLFHTKDAGYMFIGDVYDPLDDTPQTVTGHNMMDPGIHEGVPTFSPQQIEVLKRSAALR